MPGIPVPGAPSPVFPAQNGPSLLSTVLHFLVNGGSNGKPGLGFGEVPGQLAQMFNPTTKTGAVQLLGMLAGGGSPESVLNREMPGQFEAYSLPKAQASGQVLVREGQPGTLSRVLRSASARTKAQQLVHDILFGGEVHTKGSIPPMPRDLNLPRSPSANPLNILRGAKQKGFDPNDPLTKEGGRLLGEAASAVDALSQHPAINPQHQGSVDFFVNNLHDLLAEGNYQAAEKLLRSAAGSGQWGEITPHVVDAMNKVRALINHSGP